MRPPPMTNRRGQSKLSGFDRVEDDYYVEPAWCSEALIAAHPFVGDVWDPACGSGTIPKAFVAAGYDARGSDLRERGAGPVRDFLADDLAPEQRPYNIVTNPPYSTAVPFIRKAIGLAKADVAVLVRLDFLSSQRRMVLVNEAAAIYVLSKRPSMPPGGSTAPARGGQHDYCWIVWSRRRLLPFPVLRCIVPPAPREESF